jgi:hypothetical protein
LSDNNHNTVFHAEKLFLPDFRKIMKNNTQHITLSMESDHSVSADKGNKTVSQDINVLALVKGEERYVFLYNESHRAETLRILGRYASNPELSFTWYDAAVLSQKIRQESQQQAREKQQNLPNCRYNIPLSTENEY